MGLGNLQELIGGWRGVEEICRKSWACYSADPFPHLILGVLVIFFGKK